MSVPVASPAPVRGPSQASSLPRDAAVNAWPELPEHFNERWEEVARFPNFWEGHILCGLLRNEGVPAMVWSWGPQPDLTSFSMVGVPISLVHRARWVLSWPAAGDAELTFLATGELPECK